MSAGAIGGHDLVVSADPSLLAPRFRQAVLGGIIECQQAGLDPYIYEAHRSQELQDLYWHRGRDVRPPERPVTNVKDAQYGWHFFALAVDVISRSEHWFNPAGKPELRHLPSHDPLVVAYVAQGEKWFADVAAIFKKHGCKWGGDWKQRDTPHMQWGLCRPTPSDLSREAYRVGGNPAVWKLVGAM